MQCLALPDKQEGSSRHTVHIERHIGKPERARPLRDRRRTDQNAAVFVELRNRDDTAVFQGRIKFFRTRFDRPVTVNVNPDSGRFCVERCTRDLRQLFIRKRPAPTAEIGFIDSNDNNIFSLAVVRQR